MTTFRAAEYDAPTLEALERQAAVLKENFRKRKYESVEPPVLQPADIFLDRSGEDIRRRMYVFPDPGGTELCLRPDLTIPTCRMYLGRNPKASGVARLCYNGSAYRYQPPGKDAPNEFMQAGIECLGVKDRLAADVEVVTLAVDACRDAGLKTFDLELGDLGLFQALLDSLDISSQARGRLRRQFWRPDYFRSLLQRMSEADQDNTTPVDQDALLSALGAMDDAQARAVVGDVLELADISPVGGRTVAEIAERFLEQAAGTSTALIPKGQVDQINAFLGISAVPDKAVSHIRNLLKASPKPVQTALDRLEKRLALMADNGIDLKKAKLTTEFGRSFEYYTGFVFEVRAGKARTKERIVSGGRYDQLLTELGAPKEVPAVGFAIWTERLLTAAGAKGRAKK